MSQNLTVGIYSAYSFKCVITDGPSFIEVESPNWSHQAEWVGAKFTIEFPGKIVSGVTVTKTEPGPNNIPTFYVDDLGNHDQLKRAVLKASHKGWPVYVEHTSICLESLL